MHHLELCIVLCARDTKLASLRALLYRDLRVQQPKWTTYNRVSARTEDSAPATCQGDMGMLPGGRSGLLSLEHWERKDLPEKATSGLGVESKRHCLETSRYRRDWIAHVKGSRKKWWGRRKRCTELWGSVGPLHEERNAQDLNCRDKGEPGDSI